MRRPIAAIRLLSLLLVIAILLEPAGRVPAKASDSKTSPDACTTLYPIALSAQTLLGVPVGGTLTDIYNGAGAGNFGWLTWAGDNGTPSLVTSLTPPGNSSSYTNPDNGGDHTITIGDWVRGRPGVSNSSNVRDALDKLKTIDITVPVWDSVRGNGANLAYRVSAYAKIRLISYQLPSQNRITARFLGYDCGSGPNTPPYTDLSVCWVKHWNGTGSTEWRITNPNPVPLSSDPDTKIKYNWYVYNQFNAQGTILQSATNWDNANPNPVSTVYAQSMKLEWFMVTNGQASSILGTAIANANAGGLCSGGVTATPSATRTQTATLTRTPTPSYTPSQTPSRTSTATNTPSHTATYTPTPTETATPSATNTSTFTETPTNIVTFTPTSSETPTNTTTASWTPSQTASFTNTTTPTLTPSFTNTPTRTLTPTLPFGVVCIDWRSGTTQGWQQSAWTTTNAAVVWDTRGMTATMDSGEAAVWFQLPAYGTGLWQVRFTTSGTGTFAAYQSNPAPDGTNGQMRQSRGDGSFLVTQPWLEVRWETATLQFQTFCYAPVDPTATSTVSRTNTASATPSPTQVPGLNSDLIVLTVDTGALQTDQQTLLVSGNLSITIQNQGTGTPSIPFMLTVFEDRNGNQVFDSLDDSVLGTGIVDDLAAGASRVVTVTASGSLSFSGATIFVFVDSQNQVPELSETNNYGNSFPACRPTTPQAFQPTLKWEWTNSTTLPNFNQVISAPVVADLNQDNIPDIVFITYYYIGNGENLGGAYLRAISGNDGHELFTVSNPAYTVRAAASPAIADIDNDGLPEILVADDTTRLLAFEHDGTFKWRSQAPANARDIFAGGPSIADLDADGIPEVVIGSTVLNNDGTIRWSGLLGSGDGSVGPLSLVANLDMQGAPEIVAGNTAYRADGSVYWYAGDDSPALPDGFNAIGNFDTTPFPEVVLVRSGVIYLLNYDGSLRWQAAIPGGGGGAPTVADVTGDGIPEIGVAGRSRYAVFKADGTLLWSQETQDYTSQTTGSSVFDFDGNGTAEIIYGDELRLRIYRGVDGYVLWETESPSVTGYELPVIVDVDGDGHADIVKVSNNNYIRGTKNGIQVYSDPNWVATRRIWNQHTYHITNVNDDATIPRVEANSWERYNTYRLNVLTSGCLYRQPDLTVSFGRSESIAGGQLRLTARVGNAGSQSVNVGIPIAFYTNDPRNASSQLLGVTTTGSALLPARFTDVTLVVPDTTIAAPMWVSVDDTGGLQGTVIELDETNNLLNTGIVLSGFITNTPTPTSTFMPTNTPTITPTNTSTPLPISVPGCIVAPLNRATISGQVAITANTALVNGVVEYWPVNEPNTFQTLASGLNIAAGDTLTMFDTTLVANDSYTIRVRGQDTSGNPLNCGVLVTVVGEEKPGRVRFSVTDLTVPIVGLPISIGRTYDSLERTRNGDFGYGWTLDVSNPRLTVNPAHDVTLTMPDGRRTTFFFTPDPLGFGFMLPAYTAEAGVYGKLEAPSCLLANTAGRFFCFPGAEYSPTSYTYTDPYGRKFVMEATGKLASITDLQGNNLTFTPNGILSLSSGQSVVFSRDGQGRITQITDPTGKVYRYDYDAVGDLRTVTLPPVRDENGQSKAPLVQYLYHPTFPHLFQSGIDPRGNTMVAAQYYPDGRLKQETNAVGDTYQYAYDVPNRKTTVTNPDGLGKVETVNDSYGLLLTRKDELNRITTNSYDAKRNLKTVTDALNHTTTYDYDANGHRTKVIDPLNHTVIELTYNQYGGPTTLKNALGTTWSVGYHSNFLPQNVTDMIGTVGGYTWNERGSVLTQTDGNGKTSAFEYDQYGNRTKETNPLSESVTMTYDDMGRMLTRTDARLFTTQYRYDALGKLLEVEDADHNITRYGYDLNGNRTSVTDALNHTTTYQYDAANRLKKTIFPDSSFSETTYDFRGNRVLEIDPRGVKTFHEYDLAGQLRRVTAGYGSVDASTASYDYDDAGRRTALTDGNNRTTFYHYDDAGRLSYTVDPLGYETHSYYDDAGQLIRMVDANLHETRYEYDARGRQRFTIFHDNSYTEQQYDGAGRVMVRFDPARKPTTYTYDDAGRLLTVKNALNHTTSYAYDANGNLVSITDANTYSTTFGYDALGRQSRKTWPDSTYETWQYDAVGNMRFHRLADGNINETRYDTLNRPMLALYYDGQQTSYTYEANSLPKTVTDARGVTTYAYDGQNRVQSITLPDLRSVSYTWDGVGNRASMTSPAGTVNYVYDNANRLKEVREGALLVAGYTYDPVGLRKTLTRANGVTTDYAYDALNRLTDIRHTKVPQNPLASYHYQLGAAGNRLSVTEQDGTVTFWGYDDTYRLTSETRIDQFLIGNGTGTPTPGATATGTLPPTFQPPTNTPSGAPTSTNTPAYTPTSTGTPLPPVPTTSNQWQTLFTYDATGNRLTKTEDGTTVYYRYNNLDQLLCYGDVQTAVNTDCAGQTRQTYDGRGNLSSTSTGGNLTTYGWDARDRMTGATVNGTQVAAFVYDDGGRRLQQTNGTQITNYLWDELSPYGDVIQETDGTGASVASYILGGVELLTQKRGGVTSFYLQDGQMSVRLLTDTSGGVLNRYTYDAFGATRDNAGSTPNVYLYTAQRVVPEFGLYDLRARSYGPDTGRLLQRDLNGIDLEFPLELNRYVYVANDPANFDDPSGYGLYELGVRFIETINQQKARFAMLKVFIGKKMLELCQQRGGDCSPEAIIRAVQELGAKLATDARLLTRQLAVDLGGRDLLRNVTVAVGEIEGRLYYAVNSSASQRVIEAIARLTNTPIDEIIVGDGLHAEVALYNFATSKGAELLAIGISNSGGPCPACSGVFDAVAVPVFFLGRIFIALLGGH